MARGGRREGAGAKSKWRHRKTIVIRVPEDLKEKVLQVTQVLDQERNVQMKLTEKSDLNIVVNSVSNVISFNNDSVTESKNTGLAVKEFVTKSKTLDLSGIEIRTCNGKSAVYLEDLVMAGFEIFSKYSR